MININFFKSIEFVYGTKDAASMAPFVGAPIKVFAICGLKDYNENKTLAEYLATTATADQVFLSEIDQVYKVVNFLSVMDYISLFIDDNETLLRQIIQAGYIAEHLFVIDNVIVPINNDMLYEYLCDAFAMFLGYNSKADFREQHKNLRDNKFLDKLYLDTAHRHQIQLPNLSLINAIETYLNYSYIDSSMTLMMADMSMALTAQTLSKNTLNQLNMLFNTRFSQSITDIHISL